jgi:hypothetical protein
VGLDPHGDDQPSGLFCKAHSFIAVREYRDALDIGGSAAAIFGMAALFGG